MYGGDLHRRYNRSAVDSWSICPLMKLCSLGDEASIIRKLNERTSRSLFMIFPTTQVIEMGDIRQSFLQKKDASISVGYGMLKKGFWTAFAAPEYRAMLVGASYTVNVIPGSSDRLWLPYFLYWRSRFRNPWCRINPDCKPDVYFSTESWQALCKFVLE